jgi:hypothetical protein
MLELKLGGLYWDGNCRRKKELFLATRNRKPKIKGKNSLNGES